MSWVEDIPGGSWRSWGYSGFERDVEISPYPWGGWVLVAKIMTILGKESFEQNS